MSRVGGRHLWLRSRSVVSCHRHWRHSNYSARHSPKASAESSTTFLRCCAQLGDLLAAALNGLRPDFVLLHPRNGIAVFEAKDWDLDAMDYFVRNGNGHAPR